MKVAIIYNRDIQGVINTFGIQNKEFYQESTVKKVAHSLEAAGHNVAILDGNKQIIERLENFMPRVLEGEQMGMVFNMAYGIQGESRYTHIPSLLEMLGVPYVGSSPSGHALALDKVLTKVVWKNQKLPTPDFWVFTHAEEDLSEVVYPVIVKPKMESVSFGLRVVDNSKDLQEAISFIIHEFGQQALVEQFIRGREFCVGMLGNDPVETFPVLEIDLEGDPDAIQTVDHKKTNPRKKVCPADLPDALAERMRQLSVAAFKALNLRDFARVDIRMDQDEKIYLLEINSMASLGETGSYPTAARKAGYTFESLANRMLDVAGMRYFSSLGDLSAQEMKKTGKIPAEARMRAFLKGRQPQTERLLKLLVNTNTYVRNVEGVNQATAYISNEFGLLGFTQEVFPQLEVGNMVYYTNSFHKKNDFLLLLSLDNTIKLSQQEGFTEQDQYLEGSGIWENKGGIAIVISALQALRNLRLLRKIRIGVLLITDSSIDGRYSKGLIQRFADKSELILAFSGSSRNGGLVLSRSGSAVYHLETKLVNKTDPEAVTRTALSFNKLIASITDITQEDKESVIAPYDIRFTSNIFKMSAYGTAGISVRFNTGESLSLIESRMKKLVSTYKKNKQFQLQFKGGLKRHAMEPSEKIRKVYKGIRELAKRIDVRVTDEHRWSSSDICHIEKDVPRLDGMGPVGAYLPSNNERILRHSLLERAHLLALTMSQKE